jgi:hypothetical protein
VLPEQSFNFLKPTIFKISDDENFVMINPLARGIFNTDWEYCYIKKCDNDITRITSVLIPVKYELTSGDMGCVIKSLRECVEHSIDVDILDQRFMDSLSSTYRSSVEKIYENINKD